MKAEKHLVTVGLVAAGVLVAGFIMSKFSTVALVSDARAGYRA